MIDDRAGNQSQCLGVSEALGLKYEIRDLKYTPAAALPNFIMGETFSGLTASSRVNLIEPWPDLIIAAGRRCSPVACRYGSFERDYQRSECSSQSK